MTASLESTVVFLEKLASDPSSITSDVLSEDHLRKRLLLVIQKLVPELETPEEACQRILYNVSSLVPCEL